MDKFADLHIHTFFSDSTASPEEVIIDADKAKISCIAITDHDTVAGIAPTVEAAKSYNIEVVPGIELSSSDHGRDIHILGYFVDYTNKIFLEKLDAIQNSRILRMKEMIEKLFNLGIKNISLEEVSALSESKSVGRPHLANILIQKGHVGSMQEAFDKYLAEGALAYVGNYKLTPQGAIALIKEAGGVSVLAHPMVTNIDERIPKLVEHGLNGIEVFYPNCADNVIRYYTGIAEKRGLLMTGGSDAHGRAKKNTYIGRVKLPYSYVEKLKEALKK